MTGEGRIRPVSVVRSAKTLALRAARGLNGILARVPWVSDLSLIVANEPRGDKVRRILGRLQFYFRPFAVDNHVRVVKRATLLRILLARTVVEVDEGIVPAPYHWRFGHIFKADFERNPVDGWELCRISQRLAGLPTNGRRAEAYYRLREAVRRIQSPGKRKAYVFGTGPSLASASDYDFSDGYVIVCNTIVRDEALWRHLKPDFIVAGDAIYHFGHTAHARAFRADLRKRLAESNGRTHFVYPELYDAIVRREFAELTALLIPIPFGGHTEVHVNLCERFELPELGNVLNALLLPLACTISKSVWLWGFDGRAPDDKLFWSNSGQHAYPELVPELQQEHPAFFADFVPKGRESSYVQSVHGDALDERLSRAEAQGWEFVMMHFSWTATLNKRVLAP